MCFLYLSTRLVGKYTKDGVYGISRSNQAYASGQQIRNIPTTHLYSDQNEAFIDMKFNFFRGELSFLDVGDEKMHRDSNGMNRNNLYSSSRQDSLPYTE